MDRLQKVAIVLSLIDSLRENGSWAGETHVQKAMYCLQEVASVPTEFNFILYKHGPFSFDLRDELTAMRADGLLELKLTYPFGSKLFPTASGKAVCARYPKTMVRYERQVSYIARGVGGKGVAELERLATALYVTKTATSGDVDTRASSICELKPHIRRDQAMDAVQAIDELIAHL